MSYMRTIVISTHRNVMTAKSLRSVYIAKAVISKQSREQSVQFSLKNTTGMKYNSVSSPLIIMHAIIYNNLIRNPFTTDISFVSE